MEQTPTKTDVTPQSQTNVLERHGAAGGGDKYVPIPVQTTVPDYLARHDISDEELDMLLNANRDGLSEAMWGFFGIAFGSVASVIENVKKAFIDKTSIPLTWLGTIELLIFAASLGIALCILFVAQRRNTSAQELAEKIRKRKKHVTR